MTKYTDEIITDIDDEYYLSDRQHEILDFVYKFRFINRKQIQDLFGHKDPRRVNEWLKDLVDHKYLGRIFSNKLLENTKPAIYFLANEGIGWARINYYEDEPLKVKRFYQDKTASQRFINHCINVCNLFIKWKPLNLKGDDRYLTSTSTELWYNEELKNIRPDAYIETNIGMDCKTFFLEVFEDYVPMYAIRYKIDQYIEFVSNTDEWDVYAGWPKNGLFVRLVFPSQQKLNRIKKYILKRFEESYDIENLIFLLATYKQATDDKEWQEVREE